MKKLVGLLLALALMLPLTAVVTSAEDDGTGEIISGSGTFTVEEAVQRALDYAEIQSVAGKHEYYHTALRHANKLHDLWAQEADDISRTNNTQKYAGREAFYGFLTDLAANIESSLQSANAIDS